ncbi:Vacuolar membrane amino acid uptake transporter fnx2 [Cyphellophora attinorum]|uniref:Vacuolar membrane amino acid uptake transporter fnx2 n=1 Tax=Cyphellophora attinorum TaxID=1664694 RepID=A0A0N0NN73_9EURO|nr:Vacuolar membrane amino acid uptake transporter fnx2 [Phialophora attinorum]KPI41291.1 Vacuolar membrane amino acid uptake transporter fnx2 [Phialophora attinorum]
MVGVDERTRLLLAQGAANDDTEAVLPRPTSPDSESSSTTDALRQNHFASLRRHSSAGLQAEDHQHGSATRHWKDQDEESSEDSGSSKPSTFSIWATVPILLLGVFVANADGSLVIASSQHIASEFEQLSQASWLVTSYVLAQCAAQPLYGKLSDIYGRKANLVTAYVFFALGLFLCGIGSAYWHVIAGRVVSGVGGAGMTALVSIIIADLVPVRNVAAWRSFVNVAATVGRALGGPVGGWLTDTIGWRWSFFGQCPLTLVGLLLILWKLPKTGISQEEPGEQADFYHKLRRVDFAGAISLAATISSFLLTLDFVANELEWYFILAPGLSFFVFAVAFYAIESRWAKEPVLPLGLITRRDAITPYLIGGFQIAAQFGAFYATPIYFQIAAASTVSQAGLRLVPAVVGNATGGILSGWLISKTGRYKLLTLLASIAASIGYLLMLIRWRGVTNWGESMYIFLGGFGSGIIQSTTFIHLAASLPQSDIAIAGTTLYLAQNLFLLVGIQSATTILHARVRNLLESSLQDGPKKEYIIDHSISSISYILRLPERVKSIVVGAYISGLNATYGLSLACAIAGLVIGLTLIERRL